MARYGSFEDSMMNVRHKNDRAELYGLYADINKLPVDDTIPTGSYAMCLDRPDVLIIYCRYNHSWYDGNGNVIKKGE